MKSEGFADLHQHVLWGLDDGPQTSEQMRALLRQDVEEGIQLVFATAHAYPKLRAFDLALYRERLLRKRRLAAARGSRLRDSLLPCRARSPFGGQTANAWAFPPHAH